MDDFKKIERTMFKLGRLWVKHPKQRLGQILINYVFKEGENIFNVEDKEILKRLK